MRVKLETTCFLLVAGSLFGTAVSAQSLGGFSTQRLSQVDKVVSSDAFQGRGTASAIEPTVISYIADQLRAAGVEPGGDLVNGRRSWFEKVPLLESQITGVPQVELNENGSIVALRQGPDAAILAPLNGASRIDIDNAPLVFVGYGVNAPGTRLGRFQRRGHAWKNPRRAGQ